MITPDTTSTPGGQPPVPITRAELSTNGFPFVAAVEVHKHFAMGTQVVKALNGATLNVAENSFTLIMGPSGSGKSTLLYLLGGLDRPTSGTIHVGGESIDAMDENALAKFRREKVGFVFQSFNLISSMSALENVAFPMRFSRVPRRQRLSRAMDLLDRVGLADRAHHKPTELSGGQQQRVSIARALVNNPSLVLADEPTGNLDSMSGIYVMNALSSLHEQGTTLLVVTHDTRNRQFATGVEYILDGVIVGEAEYQQAIELSASNTPLSTPVSPGQEAVNPPVPHPQVNQGKE